MNKKKLIVLVGIFLLLIIILSLSSLAYYTNIGKWLDQQKNPYSGGEGQKRLSEDFIVEGCGIDTILDTVTGLCWDKNLNRFGSIIWTNAINSCNDLVLGGHNDWKLADKSEYYTLVDEIGTFGQTCSTLNSIGFINCIMDGNWYWTATTYNPSTTNAYNFNFAYLMSSYTLKTGNAYFACVRRN